MNTKVANQVSQQPLLYLQDTALEFICDYRDSSVLVGIASTIIQYAGALLPFRSAPSKNVMADRADTAKRMMAMYEQGYITPFLKDSDFFQAYRVFTEEEIIFQFYLGIIGDVEFAVSPGVLSAVTKKLMEAYPEADLSSDFYLFGTSLFAVQDFPQVETHQLPSSQFLDSDSSGVIEEGVGEWEELQPQELESVERGDYEQDDGELETVEEYEEQEEVQPLESELEQKQEWEDDGEEIYPFPYDEEDDQEEQDSQPPRFNSYRTEQEVPPLEIHTSIAQRLQSMILVGSPGAGKGMLVAQSLKEIRRLHPDVQIWVIDPKGADSEEWYWDSANLYLPLKLEAFSSEQEIKVALNKCDQLLRKFAALKSPKLLVIDEALSLKEKNGKWFAKLMSGFNTLCSMGRESRSYGWILSQSPVCADIKISGGMISAYRRVMVVSQDNVGLVRNSCTFFTGQPYAELFERTGRVYFDSLSNSWGVVPAWGRVEDVQK